MNLRNATILFVGLVVGVVCATFFPPRVSPAQPKGEQGTPGRFQMITHQVTDRLNDKTDRVVVLDTATGQCWSIADEDRREWRDLSSPMKVKK
jgi:hypothetical protein